VQIVLDRHRTLVEIKQPNARREVQEIIPTRCCGGELSTLSQDPLHKSGFTSSVQPLHTASKEETRRGIDNSNSDTFSNPPYQDVLYNWQKPNKVKLTVSSVSREIQELEDILNGIAESQTSARQQYGRDMVRSLKALKMLQSAPKQKEESIFPTELPAKISRAQHTVHEQFQQLCKVFKGGDPRALWLREGGLWPCITPITLLEQLRSVSGSVFGDRIKENLVTYALSITALQRFIRMEDAHQKGNPQKLLEEQKNSGYGNWQPLEHPDWLLLEINVNILIRPDQVDIALATIFSVFRSNSVLQMNMGQGKFIIVYIICGSLFRTQQIYS